MNTVPPVNLSLQYQQIHHEVTTALQAVLASGYYIGGTVVEQFEQQLANYIGVSEVISCNSGTDALFLALRALEIGPGDEVITTPFTFIATAEMISAVGATPVFVDIEADTFNLDIEQIKSAITEKTRAIIPVHLFGLPVNMTRLMAIAKTHDLMVIEDCAQATGAQWQGQKVGSIGHIGCFSFFPTKNLGACGDGGAITTHDSDLALKISQLKDHGQSSKYCSETVGVNSRLDSLQAAILSIKLQYLDRWNQQRIAIARRYDQFLSHIPGITVPQVNPVEMSVWNQYTLTIDSHSTPSPTLLRDQLRTQLQQQGIGTMIYYPIPLHMQPIYQNLGYHPGRFPIAERVAREVLSLPMFPELSDPQQDRVIDGFKTCWAKIKNY
ncbi:MAG: DegT/DnrJ/EryC1/StrS family aminotransferase [Microcoleaceae cyanobacterium]